MADHLETLRQCLLDSTKHGTFACGGSVAIKLPAPSAASSGDLSPTTAAQVSDQIATTRPVTIRFGPSGTANHTLTLPRTTFSHDQAFAELISRCEPATFGRGGEDVFDETYRRATKLDTTEFCTDFSPYEVGIVDVVAQLLVPRFGGGNAGVRAELYKLNVYCGPAGWFKRHVDTPVSEEHFGSLVVCLPMGFEGGDLVVSHGDRTVAFEWRKNSENAAPAVQWAAFYSDCEHEILPVTAGYRVMLTYNLFLARGVGRLAGQKTLNLDRTTLPLYKALDEALVSPSFMPRGGKLGIRLAHVYPHTHDVLHKTLPKAFKGTDMELYEALVATKLPFELIRDLDVRHDLDDLNEEAPYEESEDEESVTDDDEEEGSETDDGDEDTQQNEGGQSLEDEHIHGMDKSSNPITGYYLRGFDRVQLGDGLDEESSGVTRQLLMDEFGSYEYRRSDVTWLGGGRDGGPQLSHVFMVYGNQASLSTFYSSAAFLVGVPSFKQRGRQITAQVEAKHETVGRADKRKRESSVKDEASE